MALAIFDLDETLLAGDSDQSFGQFLVDQGMVDATHYKAENDRFHEDYKRGELDIQAYLSFCLAVLTKHPLEALLSLRQRYVETIIKPMLLPKGLEVIQAHREKGDFILMISATNEFVVRPIADLMGVDHLLATRVEMIEGQYTGKPTGVPCFQAGKITNLEQWLKGSDHEWAGATFYSDSRNDIPLLSRVDHPVAVDPDDVLRQHAIAHGWSIVSFR